MLPDRSENDALMLQGARLRVQGKTWVEVGATLNRSDVTVRNWQYKCADRWRKVLLQAIDETLPTYETEALLVCRKNLRSEDARVSETAARDLLQHARDLRGKRLKLEHSGPDGGPVEIIRRLSDDELRAIIALGDSSPTNQIAADETKAITLGEGETEAALGGGD